MQFPDIQLYNYYHRKKEHFTPLVPPHVGMYVCGPTVYGEPHIGNARPAIVFDLLFRMLRKAGYSVRYVRNITDVGHMEDDQLRGGDKISEQARIEQSEPMEVVQRYSLAYHDAMRKLNTLPPDIEPRASGHITEQVEFIQRIMDVGYAYESNGSVYFDLRRYAADYSYGDLSHKVLDDLLVSVREGLVGNEEKRFPFDFALWKAADSSHLMQWSSPWGRGYPGWHLECTVMSIKYLGEQFDIHGGGIDLQFPHHEAEISQGQSVFSHLPAIYWMYNNILTVKGEKMSKSKGNVIKINQVFTGDHPLLSRGYSPPLLRFFFLRTHYRTTIDFSPESLEGAEGGLERLLWMRQRAKEATEKGGPPSSEIGAMLQQALDYLCDDLNTPRAFAQLFEVGTILLSKKNFPSDSARDFIWILDELLGIQPPDFSSETVYSLADTLIHIRNTARKEKNFVLADEIRSRLQQLGLRIEDGPDGKTRLQTLLK